MSFKDWKEEQQRIHNDYDAENAWYAGAQSRQEEVDELNRKIAMYQKHVNAIKFIHENHFNQDSDTSWILGNLDGFFGCLESDLKGKENEH